MFYAWSVDAEVGGYGRLLFDTEQNDICIQELFLVKQEVHQTECNLKADGTAALYQELIDRGEPEKIGDITLWWHSHKNMGASFSSIDDELMRTWPGNYLISLVVNRDGKMSAQLMTKSPLLVVGDIDVAINWFDTEKAAEWNTEIEKKVTKSTPVQTYNKKQGVNQGTSRVKDWDKEDYLGWHKGQSKNPSLNTMTEEEWNRFQEDEDGALEEEIAEWQKMLEEEREEEEMDDLEKANVRKVAGC
jgi:proteasome lid subunit RPN8/RPN11